MQDFPSPFTWVPPPFLQTWLDAPPAKWATKIKGQLSLTKCCDLVPPCSGSSSAADSPGVQENKLHVQTGSEHEHVAVKFDLRNSTRRQGVTHSHQAHILVAPIKRRHIQAVLADLQVAATVNDLCRRVRGKR